MKCEICNEKEAEWFDENSKAYCFDCTQKIDEIKVFNEILFT